MDEFVSEWPVLDVNVVEPDVQPFLPNAVVVHVHVVTFLPIYDLDLEQAGGSQCMTINNQVDEIERSCINRTNKIFKEDLRVSSQM